MRWALAVSPTVPSRSHRTPTLAPPGGPVPERHGEEKRKTEPPRVVIESETIVVHGVPALMTKPVGTATMTAPPHGAFGASLARVTATSASSDVPTASGAI